jgi:hypothetical protein
MRGSERGGGLSYENLGENLWLLCVCRRNGDIELKHNDGRPLPCA